MRGPRRPCWIIRVHPPLAARRMVEPLGAARSMRPVHPNLRLAACLAPFKARLGLFGKPSGGRRQRMSACEIALRSTVKSAARAAGRNRLAILRDKLIECKLLAVI